MSIIQSWLLGDSLGQLDKIGRGDGDSALAMTVIARNVLLSQHYAESEARMRRAEEEHAERHRLEEAEADARWEARNAENERIRLIEAQRKDAALKGDRKKFMDAYPTEDSSVNAFMNSF